MVRRLAYLHPMKDEQHADELRVVQSAGRWCLVGDGPADLAVINEFLGYVADRGYSPRTERAYAFDLLAFARWLVGQDLTVGAVTTDTLLRFLTFCRAAVLQALMGHDRVDSSAAYIHLAPTHVRASYDAARARQRADV